MNIAQAGLQLMCLLPPPPHSVFVLPGTLNCFSKHCDKPVGGNNIRAAYLEATVHPGRDGMTAEGLWYWELKELLV